MASSFLIACQRGPRDVPREFFSDLHQDGVQVFTTGKGRRDIRHPDRLAVYAIGMI
jgi:hypothetical protein